MKTNLPDINQDFAQCYNKVVYSAELANQSPVRLYVVIRPYGFSIWENIKKYFKPFAINYTVIA